MAELILKINDGNLYEDGDIICAFNGRRISEVHLYNICSPSNVGFNGDGLREIGTLVEVLLRNVSEFRFERVSHYEIKRTNICTGDIDIVSNQANGAGEYIDVAQFLQRRRNNINHAIFGESGSELWYGGNHQCTIDNLDKAWTEVEELSGLRKASHELWPLTSTELKHCLALSVDDFEDEDASVLVEAEVEDKDGETVVVKKRKRKVKYKDMNVMSADTQGHIQDVGIEVDVRGANHINKKSDIVIVKE